MDVRAARWLGWLALCWAAVAGPVPAAAQESPATASVAEAAEAPRGPALWLLADEDTRIYLFGTVHVLPPGLEWRTEPLDRAIEEADELVMETGEEDAAADEAAGLLFLLGKSVPVHERVSPEYREALVEILDQSTIGAEGYAELQTWAVSLMLEMERMAQAYGVGGAGGEAGDEELTGVEDVLTVIFQEAGKPIHGLETAAEQIGFLRALPLGDQREMLEATIAGLSAPDGGFEPGEPAWMSGDVVRLGREMKEMGPVLYDVLLTRRNARWTEWLVERMERPGAVLFAVGAGHLAGRNSVQAMLEARGFRVERIH